MRRLLAASVVAAMLLAAGAALAARGYSDSAGDSNAAPDITSVDVVEATAGVVTVTLRVGNYQSLPASSWVNLWFDLDSDQDTGAVGDEALVRYRSEGGVELYAWDGAQLAEGSTDGVSAGFTAGVLTVSFPRASIRALESFGILAVSSRAQMLGENELVASDFAPNVGRSAYGGPASTSFPDPTGDQDAAPDVTSVQVSDAKSGWITFSITTANFARLPSESGIIVTIDADSNPETGDGGAELTLSFVGGEIALDRWNGRRWTRDAPPTRIRARNSGNLVGIDLHVSELGNARRFGFSVVSVDFNTATDTAVAVDLAPNDYSYWGYALANRPALVLAASDPVGKQPRARAGRPFAVSMAVTRSDTGRPIASGTVGCSVRAAGTEVVATGSVVGGSAQCSFVVPLAAKGKVLRGTISVRSGGKTVARAFAFVVR